MSIANLKVTRGAAKHVGGSPKPAPAPVALPTPAALRFGYLRKLVQSGQLADAATRRARRATCMACDYHAFATNTSKPTRLICGRTTCACRNDELWCARTEAKCPAEKWNFEKAES